MPRYTGRRVTELRRAVLAEYGPVCWLCRGGSADPDSPGPDGLTVDHIIPRNRGGDPWDLDNCRPAHRSCNSSRHDGPPTPRPRRPAPATYPAPSRAW